MQTLFFRIRLLEENEIFYLFQNVILWHMPAFGNGLCRAQTAFAFQSNVSTFVEVGWVWLVSLGYR